MRSTLQIRPKSPGFGPSWARFESAMPRTPGARISLRCGTSRSVRAAAKRTVAGAPLDVADMHFYGDESDGLQLDARGKTRG